MTRLDEHGPVGARLVVLPLIPLEHRCEDHQRGGAFIEELAGQIPPDAGRPLVPDQPLERMSAPAGAPSSAPGWGPCSGSRSVSQALCSARSSARCWVS